MPYLHALRVFSDWCQERGIELVHVMPGHVGRYLSALDVAVPTRKVHLSALRVGCDQEVSQYCSQLPRGNWRPDTWS